MRQTTRLSRGLAIATIIGMSSWGLPSLAQISAVNVLNQELQLAVCLNDWETALTLLGPMIANTTISDAYREDLLQLRYQLQDLNAMSAVVGRVAGCDESLGRTITVAELPPSFVQGISAYDEALADALEQGLYPHEQRTGYPAIANYPDLYDRVPEALVPAVPLDTTAGFGVAAGQVSVGQEVFSFLGAFGDRVNINVQVTQAYAGTLYDDDDSQIFLFNAAGQLLLENDDLQGLQSQITDFLLPETGVYYLAVTTYNNDPVLATDRTVLDWGYNGGSNIEYTLTLTGVTPLSQIIRPEAENAADSVVNSTLP